MRRGLRILCGLAIVTAASPRAADARWGYPRGYGGYGWGGWGGATDPAGGYMAGLGSYARGQGAYQVENAQAQAINLETMLKWNKSLRARQAELRQQQEKDDARAEAERETRLARRALKDGTTLNRLLGQVYDLDPAALKSSRAKSPIPGEAIREIPFEWDSEALTICLDQMTATDSLPDPLMRPAYLDDRNALRDAVRAALREDEKGSVSPEAAKRVAAAIAKFRDRFLRTSPDFDPAASDAGAYFTTLASLTKMLNDPGMQKILAQLDRARDVPLGELVAFMHSYNLRFGPSTSDRQARIYETLARALGSLADDLGPGPSQDAPGDKDGAALRGAARDAFKGMSWDDLQAPARDR